MRKKNEPQGKSKVWLQVASTALFSHWKIRLIHFKMIRREFAFAQMSQQLPLDGSLVTV